MASKRTQKRILHESRLVNSICVFSFMVTLLTNFSFLPIVGDEDEFTFFYIILKAWFKTFYLTKTICFLVPFMILNTWCLNSCLVLSMYIPFQMIFQLYLLEDFVENHIKTIPVNANNHMPVKVYQKLKECIMSFHNFQR